MLELALGTLLAIGALAVVLYPIFAGTVFTRSRAVPAPPTGAAEQDAVVALREIEFDRATGKLSDSDYAELHSRYTQRALDAMRGGVSGAGGDDPAEAAVLAYRARLRLCSTCGPRPEPDAIYCSTCGHYLPGACASCGAVVSESGAAYCTACGRQLAA